MTKLYLDTEFNGFRGSLISMALVSEDGQVFYEVLPCHNPTEWVKKHVVPVLMQEPVGLLKFQQRLESFLNNFEEIHIIADWPTDIELFSWALISGPGERVYTPPITLEIKRSINTDKSRTPHNALADAKALKKADE